jgi:hypothetical protein
LLLFFFFFFFCLYLLTFKGICTGDNLLHYDLVVNTVKTGQPALPTDRYDLEKQPYLKLFVAEGLDGRLYVTLSPGLALASIPIGAIGVAMEALAGRAEVGQTSSRRSLAEVRTSASAFFVGLINPVVSALLIVVFFSTAIMITDSVEWSTVLSLILGIGTIVWPYSSTYWTQPLASLSVFGAFFLLVRGIAKSSSRCVALSGLIAGFGFLTRYETVFVLPWLILFIFLAELPSYRKRIRFLVTFVGSYIISVVAMMCWNVYRFGSVLDTGAGHQTRIFASLQANLLDSLPANLVSLNRSIFLFSPPLILFFFGIVPMYKKNRAMAVTLIGIVLSGLILYSKFTQWSATSSWGPRFLVVLTPFLLLPAAMFRPRRGWRRVLVAVLLVVGVVIQLIGVLVPYQHGAVADYFGTARAPQGYYSKSEIVPHLHQLLKGSVDLWWLRSPALVVLGMCLIAIQFLIGRRLIRTVKIG